MKSMGSGRENLKIQLALKGLTRVLLQYILRIKKEMFSNKINNQPLNNSAQEGGFCMDFASFDISRDIIIQLART